MLKKNGVSDDKIILMIVDDLKDIEEEMLIRMNKRQPEFFDVYRINVTTGEMEMIAENAKKSILAPDFSSSVSATALIRSLYSENNSFDRSGDSIVPSYLRKSDAELQFA